MIGRAPASEPPVTCWAWALALLVLGSRLGVLAYAGNPLPFYDQWLAEFNSLLLPISAGEGFATLFERHNEHVLATTRLLTLLGFLANGYWDVPFLSVCSALVRATTSALVFRCFASGANRGERIALWIVCAAGFAIPLSSYNLLSGLQISLYLTDLALLVSLHATLRWSSPITGGCSLVIGTLVGVMSMASGILIPFATLSVHLTQQRDRPGFWPAWLITLAVALIYAAHVLTGGASELMNPQGSVASSLVFFLKLLSWPQSSAFLGVVLAGLVTTGVLVLRWRQPAADATGALVGIGVYAVLTAMVIAANRDPGSFHSRHWDAVGLLPLTALALGIRLAGAARPRSGPAVVLTSLFALVYLIQLGIIAWTITRPALAEAHHGRDTVIAHYRALLLSDQNLRREADHLRDRLNARDYTFFDDPTGRFAIHHAAAYNLIEFRPAPGVRLQSLLAPEILPLRAPSLVSRITAAVRDWGWLAGAAGVSLALIALRRELRPRFPLPTS